MTATSQKHPASLPLTVEAHQLTISIRSIFPPHVLCSAMPRALLSTWVGGYYIACTKCLPTPSFS